MRLIGYLVAATVIIRLVLNHRVIGYEGEVAEFFSWVIYGCGLPAAALFGASRLFGDARRDPLATLCEAGAVGFGFLMVAAAQGLDRRHPLLGRIRPLRPGGAVSLVAVGGGAAAAA